MTVPDISVVIPTFNAGPRFIQLLEALRRQTLPASELVVIDSGSTDGTPERAEQTGARVLKISKRRFNHGRTRNQAIAATRGALIVLTVQDALPVDSNWLSRLCMPLLEDTTLAGSYGLQRAPENAPPLSRVRNLMWERTCPPAGIQEITPPDAFWALPPLERLQRARFDNVTACLRRSVWKSLPLPEVNYAEDLIWGVYALLQGYRIAWVPQAQVWHYHQRSMDYEFRRAFVDGIVRARILRWPASRMSVREALALWREARHPQLAIRYPQLRNPALILETLWEKEVKVVSTYDDCLFVRIYREIIDLSWGLVDFGAQVYPGEILPEGLWPEAAAFGTVTTIGLQLGLAAAKQKGLFWRIIRHYLSQGM